MTFKKHPDHNKMILDYLNGVKNDVIVVKYELSDSSTLRRIVKRNGAPIKPLGYHSPRVKESWLNDPNVVAAREHYKQLNGVEND